jgi:hypothetical protein
MMSPVLGTKSLHKQASWMMPLESEDEEDEEVDLATVSATASMLDEDDDAVADEASSSKVPTPEHSLKMGKAQVEVAAWTVWDRSVAYVKVPSRLYRPLQTSVEEEAATAREKAASIKRSVAQKEICRRFVSWDRKQ